MKGGSNLALGSYVTMVVHTVIPTNAHDARYFLAAEIKKFAQIHLLCVETLIHTYQLSVLTSV